MVASVNPLSEEAPPDGEVAWQDGTTTKVPLLSAQDAIVAIESTTEAPCSDCAMLLVTDARLTSGPIQTTRGPRPRPIWEFTVQGTAVKVTRVAIADPVVVAPDEVGSQLGLAIDSASGSVGGTELTVAFVGAPDPGNKPCGEDYTAEAVESDLAVVVIVTRHPHATLGGHARPSGHDARRRPRSPPRWAIESCSTCSREPRSPSCSPPRSLRVSRCPGLAHRGIRHDSRLLDLEGRAHRLLLEEEDADEGQHRPDDADPELDAIAIENASWMPWTMLGINGSMTAFASGGRAARIR